MDPNETLRLLRAWAQEVLDLQDGGIVTRATRGAELFEALDGWLCRDGGLPQPWHPRVRS